MTRTRWKFHLSVSVLAVVAMALALTPAVADPLPTTDEYPDVAFLARNDVPFDAQTAASMAAQLGAPVFITNPNVLADAARDGIAELNPDVIIVAGGNLAVSDDVANAAAAACDPDCTIDRRSGSGRDQTAAALAKIAADYGLGRPVMQGSNQVVGDVSIGGTLNVDALTVQDVDVVAGLNADRVDGMTASDFLGANGKAADSDLLDGKDSTHFLAASGKAADSDLLDGRDDHFHPDNDGSGSGLDADTLDGTHADAFVAEGEAAGGSLTGTYPNPALANGSVTGTTVVDRSLRMVDTSVFNGGMTIDPPSIPAGSCTLLTVTASGVMNSDVSYVMPSANVSPIIVTVVSASATFNEIRMQLCNPTGSTHDSPSGFWRFVTWR